MKIENLRCFIPVGGWARRLQPLTHDTSKPCVRFLNRRIIEHPIVTLAEQGVRNFIIGVQGYVNYTDLIDGFEEGVPVSAKYGINPRVYIKYQPNLSDLGNADSYRINMEYYDVRQPVLVVQGDNLFDIALTDFIKKHEESGAMMTVALSKVDDVKQYGIAKLGADMRIERFVEKPSADSAPSNLANTGIYLLKPEVRKIVESEEVRKMREERKRLDFGLDLIPYLVDGGYSVYGYELENEKWYDLGTPESYLKTMIAALYGKLNIRVREDRIFPDRNVWVQGYSEESIKRREEIVRKCREGKLSIEGAALIGRHTRIGDHSRISDSNIDNFCILGEYVTIERSVIMDAVRIGDYARISDSIIGRHTFIESTFEAPTNIESNSAIGDAVRIRSGCSFVRTKVNPSLEIPFGSKYSDKYLEDWRGVVQLVNGR